MIRRPPRSTQSRSSAASDVYKRQAHALYDEDGAGHDRRGARCAVKGLGVIAAHIVVGIEHVAIARGRDVLAPALHVDARPVAGKIEARPIARASRADNDGLRVASAAVEGA